AGGGGAPARGGDPRPGDARDERLRGGPAAARPAGGGGRGAGGADRVGPGGGPAAHPGGGVRQPPRQAGRAGGPQGAAGPPPAGGPGGITAAVLSPGGALYQVAVISYLLWAKLSAFSGSVKVTNHRNLVLDGSPRRQPWDPRPQGKW